MTALANECPDCGSALAPGLSALLCPVCALTEASEIDTEVQGYTLLREMARGGMGVVYEAQQQSLQRTVALKILPGAIFSSAEYRQRFQREAETAAQLNHPGIVTVHEVGVHKGQPFIAMELIRGLSLAEVLQSGPLRPKLAAELIQQVALALAHAHSRQVIHRDLKPSNILLRGPAEPVLTDFGLARFLHTGQTLTQQSQSLGSPGYLPPERAGALELAPSVQEDVYGLGAVLYHCLTGRAPFVAETVAGTLHATLYEEPAPPRLLNPHVPLDLETVCLHCLQKRPAARYPNMTELAAELSRFLNGEPVLTRPVGLVRHLLKKARRQPVVTGLSLALVLAVLTGFTASLLGWRSAAYEAYQRRVELYSSQIVAAAAALAGDNPAQARTLLQTLEPRTGESDLRGPEWPLLCSLIQPQELQKLQAHEHILTALAWSKDGQKLLSGAHNGSIKLWQLDEHLRLHFQRELLPAQQPRVHQLTWLGTDTFLTSEQRQHIRCRSIREPARILWQLPGVQFAYCAAKGILAVSGGSPFESDSSGTLELWQLSPQAQPQRLQQFGPGHRALALSDSGRWLASSCVKNRNPAEERELQLWDLHQPSASPRQLPTSGSVWRLSFSPDEQELIVATSKGSFLLQRFQPQTGEELPPLQGSKLRTWTTLFSTDGTLVTTSSDRSLRTWKKGIAAATTSAAHENEIWSAALHPEQRILATGDKDGVLKLFPYPLPLPRLEKVKHLPHPQYAPIIFSSDSRSVNSSHAKKNSSTAFLGRWA
jgi:WD40 repeat protein/predicted Ser/Thr protein kinase